MPLVSESRKRVILPWISAGFCAFLSLITILSNHQRTVLNGTDVGGWVTAFLCFLPLCFFFVGIGFMQMQREILDMRRQVAELQKRNHHELC